MKRKSCKLLEKGLDLYLRIHDISLRVGFVVFRVFDGASFPLNFLWLALPLFEEFDLSLKILVRSKKFFSSFLRFPGCKLGL